MQPKIVALGLVVLLTACAQLPAVGPDTVAVTPARESVPPAAIVEPIGGPAIVVPPAAPVPRAVAAAPPPPPPTLWDRVRAGFRLPSADGPLVREWEQWYSTRPDYVARMIERSSRFLYHVMEEVERRGMPAEVALLPMIESAYNPQAYSRAHASGMWQFIPSTGKDYGLRQNFWYDARRDPIAATGAALDYLQKLHGMFGDWDLALAAYNWGEGAVSRAIAKNQAKGLPADYENLTVPPETRNYLPKLRAVKNIVANPQAYGLVLANVPNEPYFTTIVSSRHIDVKLAARLAEMSLEDFRFLNPAHNKPVIKAHDADTILLPRDKAVAFQRNLAAHDKPLVSWQAYTVKRSDQQESIAAKHSMTVAQLREANAIVPSKKIIPGQTLMVPVTGNAEPNLPDLPAPKVTPLRHAKAKTGARTRTAAAQTGATAKKVAATKKTAVTKKAAGAPAKRAKPTTQRSKGVVVAEAEKNAPR